ncbi:hypothetical protein [Dongia sp.]|uniref:hypothetical protein n=1 Tax=Dongia sp. TaxID=1977262 RepID=UPI00375259D9
MASQILALPNDLFITFHRAHWNIATALRALGLEMSFIGHSGDEVFVITANFRALGLKARPVGKTEVVAFIIAPDDVDVTQWAWPTPLSHEVVSSLIGNLQAVIEESDDFTAHDRCALIDRFGAATSGPETGLRPTMPEESISPWHPKLLEQGQWLSVAYATELGELASKLESYRSRLAVADCEMLIASLSCHAELGIRLALDTRNDGRRGSVARLMSQSRRGSLRQSIDHATQLSDATCSALSRYDPLAIHYQPLELIKQLVAIHDEVQPTARRLRTIPRWRLQCWLDDDLRQRLPVPSYMPVEALPHAAELWLADRDPGRWLSVNPFIWAVLSHLKFAELSLLQSENGRIGRLLFSLDLHRAGWPILPWEAAIECNFDLYIATLRDALLSGQLDGFFKTMFKVWGDAIAIGDRMMQVIVPERTRLIDALRDPDCLGPGVSDDLVWKRAEEMLGCIFIESLRDEENGRILLSDLEDLGALERSATPVGALFSAPAIRRVFSGLPALVCSTADPTR